MVGDRIMFLRTILSCLCALACVHVACGITATPTDEFLLRFEERYLDNVTKELATVNIQLVKEILPGIYMFRDDGTTTGIPEVLQNSQTLEDKVSGFEREMEYVVELWTKMPDETNANNAVDPDQAHKVSTYFDMGVEGAWKLNYTGRGVVIGVTDVGVDVSLGDLKPNIDTASSYNAVDDEKVSDVTPEQFDGFPKTLSITDHGNRCVGMIAAVKNNKCGDGAAYEAKVAVLRIFHASHNPADAARPHGQIHFRYARMADGINHAVPEVDVFSNSWGTVVDFPEKSALVADAIKSGIEKGRGGKGAIHVFPVGTLGDPYANSMYSIAVNSLGEGGSLPEFSSACACTLTSAYGKGCTNMADCDTSRMLTTSRVRGCTLEFEGTSASTAIVSGVVALALQANPQLGWREVQHIVVEASERHADMAEYDNFKKNGAGKMFHPVLGFGLLNATTLVTLAKTTKPLSTQLRMTACSNTMVTTNKTTAQAKLALNCTDSLCVKSLEHVVLLLSFNTPKSYHGHVTLISPAGTESVILDKSEANNTGPASHVNMAFLAVNFWGEQANGTWTVVLKNYKDAPNSFTITSLELRVYGTGTGTNPTTSCISPDRASTVASTAAPDRLTVAEADNGSPTIVFYFLGLVTVAGVIFAVGFREMLKHKTRSQYSAIKL